MDKSYQLEVIILTILTITIFTITTIKPCGHNIRGLRTETPTANYLNSHLELNAAHIHCA